MRSCESGILEETSRASVGTQGLFLKRLYALAELMGRDSENITTLQLFHGETRWRTWFEAPGYKSEGRRFDSRWCH
jgi:hypothetical protein